MSKCKTRLSRNVDDDIAGGQTVAGRGRRARGRRVFAERIGGVGATRWATVQPRCAQDLRVARESQGACGGLSQSRVRLLDAAAVDEPEVAAFLVAPLKQQLELKRRLRARPDDFPNWSEAAADALQALDLLPRNIETFRITEREVRAIKLSDKRNLHARMGNVVVIDDRVNLKGVSRTLFGFQSARVGCRLSSIESPPSHCSGVAVFVCLRSKRGIESRSGTLFLFTLVLTRLAAAGFDSRSRPFLLPVCAFPVLVLVAACKFVVSIVSLVVHVVTKTLEGHETA